MKGLQTDVIRIVYASFKTLMKHHLDYKDGLKVEKIYQSDT
jgi:hypothetical protein